MQANPLVYNAGPSSSRSGNDIDFPALVKSESTRSHSKVEKSSLPACHTDKITRLIEIPFEQSKQQEDPQTALRRNESQNAACMKIVRETGVEISLNHSRSKMLVVAISGHRQNVDKAEKMVIAQLQQQETIKIHVPQEYHGFLIGKRGERLRQLQATTMTRINVPPSNAPDPTVITITGSVHGINEAERLIKETIDRQVQQGFERLEIPKIYHPFICGPNNQVIDEIRNRTDTKISIPPRGGPGTVFTISGKREGVAQAVAEIQSIHEQAKSYKTIPVCVKKSQHPLVFGARGSGLAEILAETGVSVEIPSDSISEEITLRGRPEDLGRALSMVYERAESSITEVVQAPNRFHKVLIGKRGAAVTELREGYEKVNIEFVDNQDRILVRGPPEEVEKIVRKLKARVAELEATLAIDTIRVDPKYFRHIIGRQGATVLRLREHNVQIKLPTLERGDNQAADEIVIEGDPAGIEKAKAEIQELVKKLENEKCKDIIIDPRIQQLLRTGGYKGAAIPIRQITDSFPKVSVIWPNHQPGVENSPSESVVQLRGDRQQVDAAAERLNKLVKQVIEDNYQQEVRIFDDFRPHIFGKGSSKLQKLLDETKTRIQYPSPSDCSDVFTIIGREENVQQAVKQLEEMQKKLANVKEIVVSIPSALTTKFVGDQAPSLRSIREQCPDVHMRFSNPRNKNVPKNPGHVDVIMIGPQEALDKAQKLVDDWNSKVAEMCDEYIVHADPRFHGFLIGRQGANLIRFRERHQVELLFPDRTETDQKLASEIRIVGSKDAVAKAKGDLEALIKTIEDEVEQNVPVECNLLRDIIIFRRSFSYPELERVRVIMPRTLPPAGSDEAPASGCETVNIKLIGQKACVEAAVESLKMLLSDIKGQVTKEYPLSAPYEIMALDRLRPQFRDYERTYHVFINLRRAAFDAGNSLEKPLDLPTANDHGAFGCLIVTGRPDRINLMYEEKIVPSLPVEEEYPLNKEFHRGLITVPTPERDRTRQQPRIRQSKAPEVPETVEVPEGQSKAAELRQKHGVLIRLPPQHEMDSNFVILRGTPNQLQAAKEDLAAWVTQCEALKADRLARSYESSMMVPTRFRASIAALRPKLLTKYDVRMRFGPDLTPVNTASIVSKETTETNEETEEATADDEGIDVSPPVSDEATLHTNGETGEKMTSVILRGYEEKVSAAKVDLENTITELKQQITEDLYIPAEAHPHLIGSRGYAIQKVMHEFKVRIEFPNRNASDPREAGTVLVTGDQADVDRACDFLIAKANDLMARYNNESHPVPREQYRVELLPASTVT